VVQGEYVMKERLYVVKFVSAAGLIVCYNKGFDTRPYTPLEEAVRYTKPELDAAWGTNQTYCNDGWRRSIVALDEWR
jgi:hypothetical protein